MKSRMTMPSILLIDFSNDDCFYWIWISHFVSFVSAEEDNNDWNGLFSGSGAGERRRSRKSAGSSWRAEKARPRPMKDDNCPYFVLNHFHFLGTIWIWIVYWVSIGLTTDRESPKLLPVREITLTNKLVTCVLIGHMWHQSPLFILVREPSC